MKVEITELSPESEEVGSIKLSNGVDIWWGLQIVGSPANKAEALKLANMLVFCCNKNLAYLNGETHYITPDGQSSWGTEIELVEYNPEKYFPKNESNAKDSNS